MYILRNVNRKWKRSFCVDVVNQKRLGFYQPLTNFRIVACEKSKTDVVLCVVKVKVQEEMKFLFLQL
jgi:hypothetical protein